MPVKFSTWCPACNNFPYAQFEAPSVFPRDGCFFFCFFCFFYSKTLQGNPLVFRHIHVIYNYISEIHTFSQRTAANFQNF